jgi:hypothetical protein
MRMNYFVVWCHAEVDYYIDMNRRPVVKKYEG